jgi:hypothetical protein
LQQAPRDYVFLIIRSGFFEPPFPIIGMTVEEHEVASAVPGKLALLYRLGFPCARLTDPRAQQIERSTHI